MDRKKLVELFQGGMEYPPGRHKLWISRCFEIHVRPDRVVEFDEYEAFAAQTEKGREVPRRRRHERRGNMFHVGRSVLRLADGGVIEEGGEGWRVRLGKKA